MDKYICKYDALAMIMVAVCFVMSSCGDDGDEPIPEPTPGSIVQPISESAIALNTEEITMTVTTQEQVGGKAVLTGSVVETKSSSEIAIVGKYDARKGCYVFDLSGLETDKTYRYQIAIYNALGQKIKESSVLTKTIPSPKADKTEIDEYGTGGGSEGMRGGVVIG